MSILVGEVTDPVLIDCKVEIASSSPRAFPDFARRLSAALVDVKRLSSPPRFCCNGGIEPVTGSLSPPCLRLTGGVKFSGVFLTAVTTAARRRFGGEKEAATLVGEIEMLPFVGEL